MTVKEQAKSAFRPTKKKILLSLIFGIVISVTEILGKFLKFKGNPDLYDLSNIGGEIPTWFCIGGSFINFVLWATLTFLSVYILWSLGQLAVSGPSFKAKLFENNFFYQVLILIGWIPCFLAYFPVIYSYDGEPQLIQYTQNAFDNHHPLVHTLFMGGCYDLGNFLKSCGINIDGMVFYSIIQMLFLSFALSYGIRFLVKRKVGIPYVLITLIFFMLFPAMALMSVTTTKDTLFSAFFVLLTVLLLESINEEKISKLKIAGIFLSAVGMMMMRRNGLYILAIFVLVSVIFILCRLRKQGLAVQSIKIKVTGSIFTAIIFFVIFESILIGALGAKKGETAEALSLPLQQIARTLKSDDGSLDPNLKRELMEYIPEEGIENYRPAISDVVKMTFNNELFEENPIRFFELYFKLGVKEPGTYMLALLYQTMGDWYVTDESFINVYKDWWRDRTGYFITDDTPVFAAYDFVEKENLLPGVRKIYESLVTECSYRNSIILTVIFNPAIYVYGTLFVGIVYICRKRKKYWYGWGLAALYLLTMIAGPCVLIRYIYPIMAILPFLMYTALELPTNHFIRRETDL